MSLINPIEIFKNNPEIFDTFLRALSTLHSTGVLEMLRERGQVSYTPEDSPNYLAVVAGKANFARGYNRALDELVYFREFFLTETTNIQPPPAFGSLERAKEAGDLTEEEIYAIRNNEPVPTLQRQSIPASTYVIKPGYISSSYDAAGGQGNSE